MDNKTTENKKTKRKPLKIVLFSILGLITLTIVVVTVIGLNMYFSFKNFDPQSLAVDKNKYDLTITPMTDVVEHKGKKYTYNDDIINVLFIGMDDDATQLKTPGQIATKGGQADTIILLSINTKSNEFFLFNILRDCMTDIAVYDTFKNYSHNEVAQIALSHAYGDSGTFSAELTEQAVSNLFSGVKIYRYIRLNTKGLTTATDLFGGVPVTLDSDMYILNELYKAGDSLTLDGALAESYLRYRDESVLTSSIDRGERQMDFIKTMMPLAKAKIKKNPLSLIDIYLKLGKHVNTNMSLPELNYIIQSMEAAGFNLENICQVPGEMKMGKEFAEYMVDKEELYDIIIKEYYNPVS